MKYLFSLLFLLSTNVFALEPRPISIVMVGDLELGRIGYVTALQGVNEGLLFEWSEDLINWNFLANISPYIVEQYWSVAIPGNWLSGRFFVRVNGYFDNQFQPAAAKPSGNRYYLSWPAVKIKVERKTNQPPMPPLPPGMKENIIKLSPTKSLKQLRNVETKKGAQRLIEK